MTSERFQAVATGVMMALLVGTVAVALVVFGIFH